MDEGSQIISRALTNLDFIIDHSCMTSSYAFQRYYESINTMLNYLRPRMLVTNKDHSRPYANNIEIPSFNMEWYLNKNLFEFSINVSIFCFESIGMFMKLLYTDDLLPIKFEYPVQLEYQFMQCQNFLKYESDIWPKISNLGAVFVVRTASLMCNYQQIPTIVSLLLNFILKYKQGQTNKQTY